MYKAEFVSEKANQEFMDLPKKLGAKTAQNIRLLTQHKSIGEPLTKKLNEGLFELRTKAYEGISRAIFTYEKGQIILILLVFVKKSQKTPPSMIKKAYQRLKEYENGKN